MNTTTATQVIRHTYGTRRRYLPRGAQRGFNPRREDARHLDAVRTHVHGPACAVCCTYGEG